MVDQAGLLMLVDCSASLTTDLYTFKKKLPGQENDARVIPIKRDLLTCIWRS